MLRQPFDKTQRAEVRDLGDFLRLAIIRLVRGRSCQRLMGTVTIIIFLVFVQISLARANGGAEEIPQGFPFQRFEKPLDACCRSRTRHATKAMVDIQAEVHENFAVIRDEMFRSSEAPEGVQQGQTDMGLVDGGEGLEAEDLSGVQVHHGQNADLEEAEKTQAGHVGIPEVVRIFGLEVVGVGIRTFPGRPFGHGAHPAEVSPDGGRRHIESEPLKERGYLAFTEAGVGGFNGVEPEGHGIRKGLRELYEGRGGPPIGQLGFPIVKGGGGDPEGGAEMATGNRVERDERCDPCVFTGSVSISPLLFHTEKKGHDLFEEADTMPEIGTTGTGSHSGFFGRRYGFDPEYLNLGGQQFFGLGLDQSGEITEQNSETGFHRDAPA